MPPSDYLAPAQGSTDVESKLCETTLARSGRLSCRANCGDCGLVGSSRGAPGVMRCNAWPILLEQAWGLPVSSAAALGLAFGRYDGWEIPWPLQQGDLYRSGRFAFSPS